VIGVVVALGAAGVYLDSARAEAQVGGAPTAVRAGQAEPGAVRLGVPKLVRSRLRPSFVQADLSVMQNGKPARPTAVTCTASFADDDRYPRRSGPGRFIVGAVRCYFGFNNTKYRDKTLVGEVAVSVGRTRVTRTFSVRIGAGTTLSRPAGAVIQQPESAKPRPAATREWHGTVHLVQARGTPGQPPGHTSLDIQLTLLPGATETGSQSWTQPVSWVATYSLTRYSDPPCTGPDGGPVPSDVGERTVARGRTGERPGSNAKDYPRVGVSWDGARGKWVIALSFFGGSGGGIQLPLLVKNTKNCGRTSITVTESARPQNLKIRADGAPSSKALEGQGTPTGFYNADDTTVTWDLTLAEAR
jgi:hypothetical protein